MGALERIEVRTRTGGRGTLVKRLGALVIACHRFGRCRARTEAERAWTARVLDALQMALTEARKG